MLIYAAVGAVGFLLLGFMLVAGDVFGGDHDLGSGHDLGGDTGPGIFSVRIMAAFLTAFGVGGILGRYYGLPHPAASGAGVLSGVVLAGAVYQFGKLLHSQQASSAISMASLVGRVGEVSVAIPAGGLGQVTLQVGGERSDHLARAAGNEALPRGVEVVITGLRGDGLVVALPSAATSAPGGAG